MTWVGVGVAAVGVGTSVYSSIQSGNAAKKAARAQQGAADRWQNYVNGNEKKSLDLLSNPSDMAAYDHALRSQEAIVSKQETLANSLMPNLVDVGKQLHGLLNGQSAPVLDNLKQQRALQRQQLVDRMNAQLGPGGQSSSAGANALNQFDTETSNILSGAQNQYLNQFMGASLSSPQVLNALGGGNAQLASMIDNGPRAKQAATLMGYTGAQSGAQQAIINAAGGEFAGDQLRAQMWGQIGSGLVSAGGAYAGGQYNKTNPNQPGGTPGQNPAAGFEGQALNQPQLGSQFSGGAPGTLGGDMFKGSNPYAMVGGGGGGSSAGFRSPNYPTQNVGPMAGAYNTGAQPSQSPNYAGNLFGNQFQTAGGGGGFR